MDSLDQPYFLLNSDFIRKVTVTYCFKKVINRNISREQILAKHGIRHCIKYLKQAGKDVAVFFIGREVGTI